MDKIVKRLQALAAAMEQKGIDAYIIPMGDYHGSEYISPYFGLIKYFTGFTGSAGTLVVLKDSSYLWTDGRYFLQADKELEGSGVTLMKAGLEDTPTIGEFLAERIKTDDRRYCIGFDGRIMTCGAAEKIRDDIEKNNAIYEFADPGEDIAGKIWDGEEDEDSLRPGMVFDPVWELDERYAGLSRDEKLKWLLSEMEKRGADIMVLTALDETAWLLNLRGSDIAYNPVFLSFMIISRDEVRLYTDASGPLLQSEVLFTDDRKVTDVNIETAGNNAADNAFCIRLRPYDSFYDELPGICSGKAVWADKDSASYRVTSIISNGKEISDPSPVILKKAVKNETEIANMRLAHIKDGVAVTKWIYAMKNMEGSGKRMSELTAAQLLLDLRKQQENFIEESFAPIIAFRENGAIVHYEPTEKTDKEIEFGKGDFLLSDTGGQYLEGTTDITRTISLGKPSEEQKRLYTAVLMGHLNLLDACFLDGAPGSSLDQLARQPLYKLGYDYRHGTGHGVGFLLNVHEGPNGFRMKYTKENRIKEGMITSDEPGVYLEGKFGIRIESLILAVKRQETEYGIFLGFEPLTMVPFDRESIDAKMLSGREKDILNGYHKKVYETICPYLDIDEKEWLAQQTAEI